MVDPCFKSFSWEGYQTRPVCLTCKFYLRDVDRKFSAKKCSRARAIMGEYWCDAWGCIACFNPELNACKRYNPKWKRRYVRAYPVPSGRLFFFYLIIVFQMHVLNVFFQLFLRLKTHPTNSANVFFSHESTPPNHLSKSSCLNCYKKWKDLCDARMLSASLPYQADIPF